MIILSNDYIMSQSDYIEYKKRANELKNQKQLSPVLSSDDYTAFKQFANENNVFNKSQTYNLLIPTNSQMVFNMDCSNSEYCSTFLIDANTQTRPNRVTLGAIYSDPSQPPKYVKQSPHMVECRDCCDKINKDKDNSNTLFSLCRVKRLKNQVCKCSMK
jgi:hypothetical protein